MGLGRHLQSRGAVLEKALCPKVLSLDGGIVRVRVEEDRRAQEGLWGIRWSDRCGQVTPYRHLYVHRDTQTLMICVLRNLKEEIKVQRLLPGCVTAYISCEMRGGKKFQNTVIPHFVVF